MKVTMESGLNADGGILVVDDHALTIELMLEFLAREFPEHALYSAGSAEEALGLCPTVYLVLVIMDIGLPGMNGIEATRKIKAMQPDIHVVMHSNHDHPVFREQCMAAGAAVFISKAQASTELIPAIARLLTRQPQRSAGTDHAVH